MGWISRSIFKIDFSISEENTPNLVKLFNFPNLSQIIILFYLFDYSALFLLGVENKFIQLFFYSSWNAHEVLTVAMRKFIDLEPVFAWLLLCNGNSLFVIDRKKLPFLIIQLKRQGYLGRISLKNSSVHPLKEEKDFRRLNFFIIFLSFHVDNRLRQNVRHYVVGRCWSDEWHVPAGRLSNRPRYNMHLILYRSIWKTDFKLWLWTITRRD